MNWPIVFGHNIFLSIDSFTQNIEHASQCFFAYWHRNWLGSIHHIHISSQTISGAHSYGSDHMIT